MIFWLAIPFFLSQVFAGIAMLLDICSFQFKERKKIILFLILAATCIGIHYLFLERYVWAAIWSIGIIRLITSYYSTNKLWIVLYVALYVVATYVLFKDMYDLILLAWMTLSTVSIFQSRDQNLRLIMMSGTSLVILFNFLIWSPIGMLMEAVFLWSNMVWYYRHYIRKKIL